MEKLTTACEYCGKIIEFTVDDTEQDWDYFDTEDLVEYTLVEKYIICSHCGEKIIIDKWVE